MLRKNVLLEETHRILGKHPLAKFFLIKVDSRKCGALLKSSLKRAALNVPWESYR